MRSLLKLYILVELLEEPLLQGQIINKMDGFKKDTIYHSLSVMVASKLIAKSTTGIYSISETGRTLIKNHISKIVYHANSKIHY